jgi:predicted transcriptional regulator
VIGIRSILDFAPMMHALGHLSLPRMREANAQDEVLADGGDDLDDEERKRLHRAIERGLEDVAAGRTIDAKTVIERLRRAALDASGTEPR